MRLFAGTARQPAASSDDSPEARAGTRTDGLRDRVPARFEALGEALAGELDIEAACSVTGRELARDGVDMAAALHGLRTTYAAVLGGEPDFEATHALCLAWSEETLGYLHQLSCEDPLTGLASLAHLRARLTEIYRGVEQRDASITTSAMPDWALVVIDLPRVGPGADPEDRFTHALRLVRGAETVRLIFPGSETISDVGSNRLVVLTPREDVLGRKVAALRTLLGSELPGTGADWEGSAVRVWIEGLPSTDEGAGALLGELART